MTKLNENFKYERLSEQAGVTNVSSCYRGRANPVQCRQGLSFLFKSSASIYDEWYGCTRCTACMLIIPCARTKSTLYGKRSKVKFVIGVVKPAEMDAF